MPLAPDTIAGPPRLTPALHRHTSAAPSSPPPDWRPALGAPTPSPLDAAAIGSPATSPASPPRRTASSSSPPRAASPSHAARSPAAWVRNPLEPPPFLRPVTTAEPRSPVPGPRVRPHSATSGLTHARACPGPLLPISPAFCCHRSPLYRSTPTTPGCATTTMRCAVA
nr:vegetative cell wall protein gp1-like [Aegilops tauschii subsp. strangulata]